ncbi:hypothetical protein [Paenibacillus kandeliae]
MFIGVIVFFAICVAPMFYNQNRRIRILEEHVRTLREQHQTPVHNQD